MKRVNKIMQGGAKGALQKVIRSQAVMGYGDRKGAPRREPETKRL